MSCIRIVAAAAFFLASSRLAFATLIDSSPVTLDLHDQRAASLVACFKPRGVASEHFDAYHVRGYANNRISATVRCAANGSISGNPVKHFSYCEKGHNGWRCDSGADYLEYRNKNTVVYLVTDTGLDTDTQIHIMNSLLESNKLETRDFRSDFNDNQCWMRLSTPGRFRLECGLVTVDVSEECRDNSCRYKPDQVRVAIP